MSKYILPILLVLITLSCQYNEKNSTPKPHKTTRVNKTDIVKKLFIQALWNERQFEIAHEIFTPDFITEAISLKSGNWVEMHGRGAESMIHHVKWWLEILPDANMRIVDIAEAEDKVIITWALSGTMQGELLGQQANHQVIKILGSTVSLFEKDKIKLNKTLLDKYGLMEQIGAL